MIPVFSLQKFIAKQVGAIKTQCSESFSRIDIDTSKLLLPEDACHRLVPAALEVILVVRLSQVAADVLRSSESDEKRIQEAKKRPLQFMMIVGGNGCSGYHSFSPILNAKGEFETKTAYGPRCSSRFIEQVVWNVLNNELKEKEKADLYSDVTEDDSQLSMCCDGDCYETLSE